MQVNKNCHLVGFFVSIQYDDVGVLILVNYI